MELNERRLRLIKAGLTRLIGGFHDDLHGIRLSLINRPSCANAIKSEKDTEDLIKECEAMINEIEKDIHV
jgi:hypothetical protein